MNIILNKPNTTPYEVEAKYSSQRLNRDTYEIKDLVDGSIDKEIVVNVDDKEAINEEAEETKKILNEEREAKREMYIRQARTLYPEKENWVIEMAVDAYILQEEKGVNIMTHKFKDLECEVHKDASDPIGKIEA
jgi:uncharacterized membrane-anchored protein